MLLEGYIEFENEIPVGKDCLGKEYPITIAGIEGVLATPLIHEDFANNRDFGSLGDPKIGRAGYKKHFDWGSVYEWPSGLSGVRACKISFNDISESLFGNIGNSIALDLPRWRNLLIDNISLILERDYRGPRRVTTLKSYGLGEFGLFRNKKGAESRFVPEEFKMQVIEVENETSLYFEAEDLQQALNDTSQSRTPLLPFYFLFDAERAKFEKNYRKSVLDSATAVEVCFSLLIGQLLSFSEDLNKYVISKHNSLRLKRELLKVLKVKTTIKEKEYIEDLDLDSVRNRVIHGGYMPVIDEAEKAYKIAKETLYTLLPKKHEI